MWRIRQHPKISRLVADMLETLADAGGVGLRSAAGPCAVAGRDLRGAAPSCRGGGAVPMTCLINPVIEPLEEEQALGWEACLSYRPDGYRAALAPYPLSRAHPVGRYDRAEGS